MGGGLTRGGEFAGTALATGLGEGEAPEPQELLPDSRPAMSVCVLPVHSICVRCIRAPVWQVGPKVCGPGNQLSGLGVWTRLTLTVCVRGPEEHGNDQQPGPL